ncbi:unnamed protein product, partial [marine sediment metagenome]
GGALGLLLVLSLVLVPASPALAVVPPGHYFYGNVTTSGGEPVAQGIEITAEVAGLEYTTYVDADGKYGWHPNEFSIPGDDPDEPGIDGASADDPIVFYIDGVQATLYDVEADQSLDSYLWESGGTTELDLTITAVVPAPVAGFSAIPTSGDEPLTIVFADASENMVNSPTWSWDFGDEGTSTDQHPTHPYLQDGSYTVTLTVTTDEGTDAEVKADYIVVADTDPVASFTADPTSGEYPLEVTFTDTSTSYDGDITSWEWDFSYDEVLGFNVEDTVQNPVYTYLTQEGIHTVALTVTDADDDSHMMVEENLITVTAPTPPTVSSTLPLDAATDVAIDVVVSATFDEDIQAGTTIGDITISGATVVSTSIAGATLTIAHDAFAYETSYTVTIPAGAVDDLDDHPLALDKVWSFTTLVQYQLIVSSTTGGTVTSPVAGTSTYDADTVVNLVAVAEASYAKGESS